MRTTSNQVNESKKYLNSIIFLLNSTKKIEGLDEMGSDFKLFQLSDFLDKARDTVSLQEMADHLSCSKAHARHLKDTLCNKHNYPIERQGNRFKLADDFQGKIEAPGLWLSPQDIVTIFFIKQIIQGIENESLSEIFQSYVQKVDNFCQEYDLPYSFWKDKVKIIPITQRRTKPKIFNSVVESLSRSKQIEADYNPLSNQPGTRMISPQKLVRYKDNWYLDGWCHKDNKLKVFALSRISKVKLKTNKAKILSPDEQQKYYGSGYGIFSGNADKTAVIHFTGIAAKEAFHMQWHPEESATMLDEHTCELKIPYGRDEELIMDILRWGEHARVIEPDELKQKVCAKLEAMRHVYDTF